ncbi:uncharacterized protein RCC_02982 [Lecanosticta acicola]|uniref:Uncharacterized protein RCC_02982 n=1 Tax=Lecanosticta acicola TaxID=111012 RepID=A0AAI8Z082_9PEZI|nr:uncharacterized protein RCC_02982 [Lecanosticta acicola]
METRSHRYEISRPQPIPAPPPPPPPLPPPPQHPPASTAPPTSQHAPTPDPTPWSLFARPLSDIRELSEPSLMDNVVRHPSARRGHGRNVSRVGSHHKRHESLRRVPSLKSTQQVAKPVISVLPAQDGGSSSYSSTPEQLSFYSIPQTSVPRRSSSQKYFVRPPGHQTRSAPARSKPPSDPDPPSNLFHSIPNRGASQSPVKEAGLRLDPITSDTARRIPSQTHVRSPHPSDIFEFPSYKHPRVKLELQLSAPLFVGGGSVEGFVRVTVDDNERAIMHRRSLSIGAVSVDLLGFEEVDGTRRATFLALGTELVDPNHPPPPSMIQPANPLFADDKFWSLTPSCTALPFMISLPLDTGPPPFQSKHAKIRYLLSVTTFLRDSGKHYRVRTSQDVHVLPTYDPEKALTSLTSPLVASDELPLPRSTGLESIKVTAGLHRQVWVSGSSIFVDVHISNRSQKPVKRLELMLERDILRYKHAAAATMEKSASQARIFESNDQTILARSCFKPGSIGWHGVDPHTSDTRTCELELARGHATVRCGKYFEVRYFLNVTASLSNSKIVSVQLPIILIHMNSLDVVPNSVAQVAAAIEEKRAHRQVSHSRSRRADGAHSRRRSVSSPARTSGLPRQPLYAPGRAFAAPRQQSLDRQREHRADIAELQQILDASPRRNAPLRGISIRKMGSDVSLGTLRLASPSTESLGVLGAMSYQTPPPNPQARVFANDESESLGSRRRRMGSFGSNRSKKSTGTTRSKSVNGGRGGGEKVKPPPKMMMVSSDRRHQLMLPPHALGLTSTTRKVGMDEPTERSATATGFREKLDRSRFEFKAVRRKASGSLKERSMNWWEQRKNHGHKEREREKDGMSWI